MLPAANRPILEHVFDALVEAGVSTLVLVVGYQEDRIKSHFGPTYRERPITYVTQEKRLGSGHALQQTTDAISEEIVVVNGDRVIEPAMVQQVKDVFEATGSPAVGTIQRPNPGHYGVVESVGTTLDRIVENPDASRDARINAGVYAFSEAVFEALDAVPRDRGEVLLPAAVNHLAETGFVQAVELEGLWGDATYPWDALDLTRMLLEHGGDVSGGIESQSTVAPSAIVHEEATVQAPATVGPNCEIGPGAVVGPNTAIGENTTVESNATVIDSVIDSDNRIGAGATVQQLVTGQSVHIGSGTTVPRGPGTVTLGDEVFRDAALGAVFADRVRAEGCNVTVPGTLVGAEAYLHTGAKVRGLVSAGTEVTG
jgi:glucose-1-phosphate thymidylyltransferase